ncbi:MAG: hypothetical protein ACR2QR_00825 [Woeseiaceae bacterium]
MTKAKGHALIQLKKLASIVLLSTTLSGCMWDPWGWDGHATGAPTTTNKIPRFTSATSTIVPEGATANVYTATADDTDTDTLSFSVVGGADQTAFSMDPASGALSFNSPPDFEFPEDSDGNNQYAVNLRVDDSNGAAAYMTVSVQVTNRNEAPLFTSAPSTSVVENSSINYIADAYDPDFDTIEFGIAGGTDQAMFNINATTGRLTFNSPPDFEAPADSDGNNVYSVELVADDGNGEASSLSVTVTVTDVSQLEVHVSFPTPNANLGGVTDTIVTGTLVDLEDGIVDFDDLNYVDVNGQMALQALDDPSRWSVQINAATPEDTLMVLANSAGGGLNTTSLDIDNNPFILSPDLIVFDPNNDRILVGDSGGLGAFIAVDLTDGVRAIIEDANTGTGPQVILPESAVLDEENNRILIVDSYLGALIAMDLDSGDRTIISDVDTGTGPAFEYPLSINLNTVNNAAYVVDGDLEAVLAVDLANGNRSVISDVNNGAGPAFSFPTASIFDVANDRLLVADAVREELIAVNPNTGNRSVIADVNSGAGLNLPISMVFDSAAGRVFVGDAFEEAILSIDLATGAGTVLSNAVIGTGPLLSFPNSMALDADRNRLLAVDLDRGKILTVDLTSGDRATLAETDSGVGDGPDLNGSTAVALHSQSDRALMTAQNDDGASLVWVDLASGSRTVLTDSATGTGPDLEEPTGAILDVAYNQALVLDDTLDALVSVDLTSGDRVVVSGPSTGSGASFGSPMSLALDDANNVAWIVDNALGALISTNLIDGNRTIVSGASNGAGPQITSPTSVVLDEINNRALVLDYDLNALIAIDLASGDRSVLSDDNIGMGPGFEEPLSLALDSDNSRVLVSDGRYTTTLFWVDLASGDRSALTNDVSGGPMLLDVPSVVIDHGHARAFAVDAEVEGLIVVELGTGQRALVSR